MKTPDDKQRFLEALKENHIVLAACRKTGIGKSSYYRWRQDPGFARAADEAIQEGVELVNDAAESNIVSAVKGRDKEASKFWLKHRHPAYATKVEIDGTVRHTRELTPEEQEAKRKAMRMIGPGADDINNDNKKII